MTSNDKPRRTIWVWAIAIFYFCIGTMTLLTFFHILTAPVDMPADQLAVIRSQLKMWTLFGLLPAANIAAAIAIFRMRRIAFHLFAGILIANLLIALVQLLFFDLASQVTAGPGLTGTIIGFGINAAVCLYTYRLMKNGQLA